MSMNRRDLITQVTEASSKLLKEKGYISVVDVLLEIGKLSRQDYDDWRFRRVPYLERVINGGLGKINTVLRTIQKNSHHGNLKPSKTLYKSWGKGPKKLLRFSKSGDPNIEQAYSTHFLKAN